MSLKQLRHFLNVLSEPIQGESNGSRKNTLSEDAQEANVANVSVGHPEWLKVDGHDTLPGGLDSVRNGVTQANQPQLGTVSAP